MAIRESQKVTYVDKVGVTSQTGRDTAVRAEARAQAEWNKTMETQSETLGKLANKADELAMKNSIENLQFEQEEYTYTDDDGLETTVKRPKQFKPDRFFWQPSQDAYDKMVVIKMKEDLGRQFEEQSFKVASDSQTRKQTADQFLQRMQPVYDQYMQNVPSRFKEYLRPKLDAKLLADQKRVSNTFRVQQEKMMQDDVEELISTAENKFVNNIIYNKDAGEEALEQLKLIPEEASGIARPLKAKFEEKIKTLNKFYASTVSGVSIRDLANNVTTAGETLQGKRNIVANLSAFDELLDNTGDQKIMVDGKPVTVSQVEFNNIMGTLSQSEKTEIQTDVRARLANLTSDTDNTDGAFTLLKALSQANTSPDATLVEYQSGINKYFNKNPVGFIQGMGFDHDSVADAYRDPKFISELVRTRIIPNALKEEMERDIKNSNISIITAVLDSAIESPSVAKYITQDNQVTGVPVDYEFIPRIDPKVNSLLRAVMVRRVVDKTLDVTNIVTDINKVIDGQGKEEPSDHRQAKEDARKHLRKLVDSSFDGLGEESPAILALGYNYIDNATFYDGIINTPVSGYKKMAEKFVNNLTQDKIIGVSKFNYRFTLDGGKGNVFYPLENFKLPNPNNPNDPDDNIVDWHNDVLRKKLNDPNATLGENIQVSSVQASRGILTTDPYDVSYYVFNNGQQMFDKDGVPIIYEPAEKYNKLKPYFMADQQSDNVLSSKIRHYNLMDKDAQETILKQEKIKKDYKEQFESELPNYVY
jgi:hypothetical protein